MKLVVVLGNPGPTYTDTRHNIGYMAGEAIIAPYSIAWRPHRRFHADIATFSLNGQSIIVARPHTFYNHSGQAVQALVQYYRLDPTGDLLVVHDDLALPLGTIRVRQDGSDAGNNGIKSINTAIGQRYWRVRVGIDGPGRARMSDADYVLGRLTIDEQRLLATEVIPAITGCVNEFYRGGLLPRTISAAA